MYATLPAFFLPTGIHFFVLDTFISKLLTLPWYQYHTSLIYSFYNSTFFADKPNITLSPEGGYEIKENKENNSTEYKLDCMAVLDPKVTAATIHWKTNHTDTELSEQKITQEHRLGVKVSTWLYLMSCENLLSCGCQSYWALNGFGGCIRSF